MSLINNTCYVYFLTDNCNYKSNFKTKSNQKHVHTCTCYFNKAKCLIRQRVIIQLFGASLTQLVLMRLTSNAMNKATSISRHIDAVLFESAIVLYWGDDLHSCSLYICYICICLVNMLKMLCM